MGMVVSFALVIVLAYWFFIKESDYFASTDIASITQNQAKKVRFNALNEPIGFDFREALLHKGFKGKVLVGASNLSYNLSMRSV